MSEGWDHRDLGNEGRRKAQTEHSEMQERASGDMNKQVN